MINHVIVPARALKQLQKLPEHIQIKFFNWQAAIVESGLEEVRRIPGYHDEPLKGERKGQRSVRLSRAYRVIYVLNKDGRTEVVNVEEVHKHEY